MRGSHLGMRIPWMGGALSTRSSHAHGRTVARRRCAVRIWGCELRGWGGVVNAEFARPRANGGQETMRGSHLGMRGSHLGMRTPRVWRRCQRGVRTPSCERRPGAMRGSHLGMRGSHLGMRTPRMGGRCQRGVRTPSCERRPGAMRGSHLGMRTPRVGGALSTRSSHALVRTAARGDARFASGDANSAGGGGVVNAEFARPRANGGQETMRGSHLGMRTPRVGGRCQRGVRTPSCERRPGDDARFASGDANSADGGGALSTRSSHALVRTAARGDARFASGDANSALASAHELPSSCQAKWYRQQELGHDQVSDEALTRLSAICQCMHQPPRRQPGQIGVA
jgi:hypothetical protein